VDWTGPTLREDKRGAIDSQLPTILQRFGIQPENWIDSVSHFQKYFLMQRVRFLLLSNSERGKIDSDLSKGMQKRLLAGLKGKAPRRNCTVRVCLFIRF